MSESKSEIKRTTKKEKSSTRVIWIYAAANILTRSMINKLHDYGSEASFKIRNALGIKREVSPIVVYPFPQTSRMDSLKHLSEIPGATIIFIGIIPDKENTLVHKYYRDAEVFWYHPRERQFVIDTMRMPVDFSYKEAEQLMKEWTEEILPEHFDKKDINVFTY